MYADRPPAKPRQTKGHTVTVTDQTTAVPVAPQPSDAEMEPAVLKDASGYFRMVRGVRIAINEPGIAVLDGTPAEAAYRSAASLNAAMTALKAQYDAQIAIVQEVVGHRKVATLGGEKVVTWGWATRTSTDNALVEALMPPEQYETVKRSTPYRSFEPAFRK